jgi:hypothetical protein
MRGFPPRPQEGPCANNFAIGLAPIEIRARLRSCEARMLGKRGQPSVALGFYVTRGFVTGRLRSGFLGHAKCRLNLAFEKNRPSEAMNAAMLVEKVV